MTFKQRVQRLLQAYQALENPMDRFDWIVQKGLALRNGEEVERIPANRIEGCDAGLWLTVRVCDGRVRVAAESDALFVRGFAAMAVELTDGLPLAELEAIDDTLPGLLAQEYPVTPQRRESLAQMLHRVRACAPGLSP